MITLPPVGVQSIAISVSVRLVTYLNHIPNFTKCLHVARGSVVSSDGSAVRYVLSVLWT